jgi:hypothetical protein
MGKPTKTDLANAAQEAKDTYTGNFLPYFSEEALKECYRKEVPNMVKLLNNRKMALLEKNGGTLSQKQCNEIRNNVSFDDYEKAYPNTTQYIKDHIWHGYDSKFYVACRNATGSFFAAEYTKTDFQSTFYAYFPEEIMVWFRQYSTKVTLSLDNYKPRSYKEKADNGSWQHFLNLFSGYKYDKFSVRDQDRINKGKVGVAFIWGHIEHIWNSGNAANFEYDRHWIRKLIAGFKLKTMIYLKSKMGRGKGKITTFIMNVLGKQVCLPLNNDKPFTGEFNGSLLGKAFVVLDEIVHDFDDFVSLYNQLKPYITEPEISYRNLYERLKALRNITSFIMTGNYDMLKLDDPSKGDDRRIKVNEVSDLIKDREYCDKLDAYCEDEDVMYAFFWDCIDNHDKTWNELQELKSLPITETKIQMIQQSLDTATMFFKGAVNDVIIMDAMIKPRVLYNRYSEWMKVNEPKKKTLNSTSFLSKLKDYKEFVTFHTNIRVDRATQTNYVKIEREKMISHFRAKHFWCEYDDIEGQLDAVPDDAYDNGIDEDDLSINVVKLLKDENAQLKKQIQELTRGKSATSPQRESSDDVKLAPKQEQSMDGPKRCSTVKCMF